MLHEESDWLKVTVASQNPTAQKSQTSPRMTRGSDDIFPPDLSVTSSCYLDRPLEPETPTPRHQHSMAHCWTCVSTAATKTSQKGWSTGRGGSDIAGQTRQETPVMCQVSPNMVSRSADSGHQNRMRPMLDSVTRQKAVGDRLSPAFPCECWSPVSPLKYEPRR